ncbi:MAG: shikimate kinase, partial [Gammaproteobacteria bacterium]
GEEGFRKREQCMIEELTAKPDIVLATGGGAILDPENRRHLNRGTVIFLHASVSQQLRRTSHDTTRPLLQTPNPRKKLSDLMTAREPLYREIADIIIKTDGNRVRDILEKIIAQAQRRLD